MAGMNAGIILAGQPVNVLDALSQGNEAAAQTNAIRQQNALQNLYQQQGAGILAGDANALNALAGIDPMAAQGIQQNRLGMEATRQDMAFSAEKMQMLRDEAKRAVADHAARMSREQREAEAAQISKGVSGAAFFYSKGDRAGYEAFLAQNGIDPATHPFEQFPALAARYEGALDALKNYDAMDAQPDPTDGAPSGFMWADPNNRAAGVVPLPGAEKPQTPYTTEGKLKADLEAGRIDQATYEAGLARLAPKGTSLAVGPDGTVTFTQGGLLDQKAQAAKQREVSRAGLVSEDIGRAKARIKASPAMTTGLIGNYLKDWAGTPAADVSALLNTVRANIGFKELNDMRQSSPTGGALGQVTERELQFLQSVLGNVEQSQSADQLLYNLDRLDKAFNEVINGPEATAGSQPQEQGQPLDDEALIQKYLGTSQ